MESSRKKVLIMAYAISPSRGSEYSVAWNFVREISKKYDVDVLYGASGLHMGDTLELEEYLKSTKLSGINFIKVEPSKLQYCVNKLNKKGFGYAFYLAFRLWHKSALRKAKSLLVSNDYELVHQLNPIGYREPGYLYELELPFIWGPIGGANFINSTLLENESNAFKIKAYLKNAINYLQLNFSTRVRTALKKADALIFCNSENLINFKKSHGVSGHIISEQAIAEDVLSRIVERGEQEISIFHNRSAIQLIWVGRLCPWKNIPFLIDVASKLAGQIDFNLKIVGSGHAEEMLKKKIEALNLSSHIAFLGNLSREEVLRHLAEADLHCLCSFSEANTTVIYESFSVYTPTISLAQNGMLDTLSDAKGFLIPVSDYNTSVNDFANKIIELSNNRDVLNNSRTAIKAQRESLSWEYKGKQIHDIYESVIEEKSD